MTVDDAEFLWNMYNEHTTQGRHHEIQRTAVVTVVLALAGAAITYLAFVLTHGPQWPMSLFLVILGLFGASFSAKQAERTRMHITIAAAYRHALETRFADRAIGDINESARDKHRQEWNWRTGRDEESHRRKARREPFFPLYWFFIGLSLLVTALGVLTWIWPIRH